MSIGSRDKAAFARQERRDTYGEDTVAVTKCPPWVSLHRPKTFPAARTLIEKSQIVILATNGADGYPQVTATWFLVEPESAIKTSLNTIRRKGRGCRSSNEQRQLRGKRG